LHCQLECGSYLQTDEAHGNSIQSQTIGDIALLPAGIEQGGFFFNNLSTEEIISRRSRTPLPMSNDVIDSVHALAEADKVS